MKKVKKRIYIAGCGGMLGDAFYKEFNKDFKLRCTDINIEEDWISYLDFRDYELYRKDVIEFSPDYLFHLGAFTDLEYCEKNPLDTYSTNTKSVENATSISNELKIPLLFISTAGIFNGEKELYNDWDKPDPIGQYAKSKYLSEIYIKENSNNYLICRAGWMMGGGPKKDKKFIQKLINQIKGGSKTLYIVNDKLGTPTYTNDFAVNVKLLIDKQKTGLYNMVCQGATSRLEVAQQLVVELKLKNNVLIKKVPSNFFKQEYFAPRPACERLVNTRLSEEGLDIMRDWKIALKDYISNYYNNYL
ncbi:MAG: SDR family oxidoreductase [Candidatus Neomarinimicrobiota bacterium]